MKLKILAVVGSALVLTAIVGAAVSVYHNRITSASNSVAVPPSGSTPLSAAWVAEFDSTQALSTDLAARRLKVFEDQVRKAEKNPLDEYQFASDFLGGETNRLGQQLQSVLQQNPGKVFDKDCRCLVPGPPTPAANPAVAPPAGKK